MERPITISVIMAVGRINDYLDLSLASINAQTFRDFELIVICDDDIRDDLRRTIEHPRFDFPRRVISSRLGGFAFALNLGLANANPQANFIARWDADDLCDPKRFQRQLEEFDARPSLGVLGTRAVLINENGEIIRSRRVKFYGTDAQIRRAMKYRPPMIHTSLMFRTDLLLAHQGYRYGHTSEDHELLIRIARDRSVEFANIPDVLSYYRIHQNQVSSTGKRYGQFCDIGGFLFTEFLRSGNPLYLVGIAAKIPLARRTFEASRRLVYTVRRFASRLRLR